jgi:hypothetical protein
MSNNENDTSSFKRSSHNTFNLANSSLNKSLKDAKAKFEITD